MKLWKEPEVNEYCIKLHIIDLYNKIKWKINRLQENIYWTILIYLVDNEWIDCPNCKIKGRLISLNEDNECIVCGQWIDFRKCS